jgi:hypothetical protein
VIIATIVEFEQRMLTNRPTVARTSVWLIWLAARRPTRAREPRTEITRPKDAVAAAIDMSEIRVAAPFCFARLCMALLEKLLSPKAVEDGQNRDIFAGDALAGYRGGIFAGV